MKWIACALVFSFASFSAALTLPQNLNEDERIDVLKILGYGSQSKLFSSPVPLGGYQGFEFGLASDYLSVKEIGTFGNKPKISEEFNYLSVYAGKGLPYNVDLFVHFTPLAQNEGISAYGLHVRWGFHELSRFPAVFSFVFHGSGANYSSLLNTRTTGADLVMTVSIEDVSLYFGAGRIRSMGRFMGGVGGITAEAETIDEDISDTHVTAGASIRFGSLILSLGMDRVTQSSYGASLGWLF